MSPPRRWTVGDVTVTKVVELEQPLPLVGLLPAADAAALEPHAGWLAPHFLDDEGTTVLSIHSLVVESGGRRILVDTCVGDRSLPGMEGLRGPTDFPDRLAAAGCPADTVDVVCCTHLHFDHVGWNTRLDGERWVPTFPNARYLFGRVEFEHWTADPGGYALNFDDTVARVVAAGQADLVETDHAITDEVRLVPSPGHTPGHVSVLVESRGERALITGDATHHPVQWAEPDWGMAGDWDGVGSAASRRALRAAHGDRRTLVIGTHYAEPTAGWIVGDDEVGYRFEV
ncbi:MAG: MBL fold metallo-hydrolase [Acidimicrobiales bacterium]|jgi:glyoxylase-like metal-dependent hydrolase (beta-lactamase superfamily II)|nr:MBL fold metallo-hydrolase [Acidimicrobiales bacterium]